MRELQIGSLQCVNSLKCQSRHRESPKSKSVQVECESETKPRNADESQAQKTNGVNNSNDDYMCVHPDVFDSGECKQSELPSHNSVLIPPEACSVSIKFPVTKSDTQQSEDADHLFCPSADVLNQDWLLYYDKGKFYKFNNSWPIIKFKISWQDFSQ